MSEQQVRNVIRQLPKPLRDHQSNLPCREERVRDAARNVLKLHKEATAQQYTLTAGQWKKLNERLLAAGNCLTTLDELAASRATKALIQDITDRLGRPV